MTITRSGRTLTDADTRVPETDRGCRPRYAVRTNLADVLRETSRGVYAITPEDLTAPPHPLRKVEVKIGLGGGYNSGRCGGIAKRLDGYHTYFPHGFYVVGLMRMATRASVARAERRLKTLLEPHLMKSTTRIRGEWYRVTMPVLDRALETVHAEMGRDAYGLELFRVPKPVE